MFGTTRKKKWFFPKKYFHGLSAAATARRKREIRKFGSLHWKNPAAYRGFATDKLAYTRPSKYTEEWNKLFPEAKSLEEKSKATGVPLKILQHIDQKAKAAWRSGHRPGATQQQWSYARLASFLLCGKTHYTADAAEVRRAKNISMKARKWFKRCKTIKLTKI